MQNFFDLSLFGNPVINPENLLELVTRFAFNLLALIILVRYIYYSTARTKN